jgi:hypothetical protein
MIAGFSITVMCRWRAGQYAGSFAYSFTRLTGLFWVQRVWLSVYFFSQPKNPPSWISTGITSSFGYFRKYTRAFVDHATTRAFVYINFFSNK